MTNAGEIVPVLERNGILTEDYYRGPVFNREHGKYTLDLEAKVYRERFEIDTFYFRDHNFNRHCFQIYISDKFRDGFEGEGRRLVILDHVNKLMSKLEKYCVEEQERLYEHAR